MNHFLSNSTDHRKYNNNHNDDINQGFPVMDAHQLLSNDDNNRPFSSSSSSSSLLKAPPPPPTEQPTVIETATSIPVTTTINPSTMSFAEQSTESTPSTNSSNSNSNINSSSTLNENDDRRLRMLEKNRRAAARCRQRKKIWIEELTQQHQEAKRRNDELQGIIPGLKEEVYTLKNQLLAHEGCDCHAVKDYIKVFLMKDVMQKSRTNATSSSSTTTS
ncbi:hypothetical protein BDA99DRAFT_558774 [Phascolomyces articulosus]|uniref:BZIP domain-containing protein n=1 Tax=Phascolomyces articulosus TaxID=60185 RepID=A0AAD5KD49_9FUNG|nr:hypothetical protein BDA99DRAFT_558774 [Phascolomyces articulosus]